MTRISNDPVIAYIGNDTVTGAIAAYFKKYGLTEEVRDGLIYMTQRKPAEFLEIVCEYVERECV